MSAYTGSFPYFTAAFSTVFTTGAGGDWPKSNIVSPFGDLRTWWHSGSANTVLSFLSQARDLAKITDETVPGRYVTGAVSILGPIDGPLAISGSDSAGTGPGGADESLARLRIGDPGSAAIFGPGLELVDISQDLYIQLIGGSGDLQIWSSASFPAVGIVVGGSPSAPLTGGVSALTLEPPPAIGDPAATLSLAADSRPGAALSAQISAVPRLDILAGGVSRLTVDSGSITARVPVIVEESVRIVGGLSVDLTALPGGTPLQISLSGGAGGGVNSGGALYMTSLSAPHTIGIFDENTSQVVTVLDVGHGLSSGTQQPGFGGAIVLGNTWIEYERPAGGGDGSPEDLVLAPFSGGDHVEMLRLVAGVGARISGALTASSDLYISGSGRGLVLTAPNGTRWRLTVDSSGVLATAAA